MSGVLIIEEQLVRLDGTVLVSFVSPAYASARWEPPPGERIMGAIAYRTRELPDGPWEMRAYYADGYPGWAESWPAGKPPVTA